MNLEVLHVVSKDANSLSKFKHVMNYSKFFFLPKHLAPPSPTFGFKLIRPQMYALFLKGLLSRVI